MDGKFQSRIGAGKMLGPKGITTTNEGDIVVIDNKVEAETPQYLTYVMYYAGRAARSLSSLRRGRSRPSSECEAREPPSWRGPTTWLSTLTATSCCQTSTTTASRPSLRTDTSSSALAPMVNMSWWLPAMSSHVQGKAMDSSKDRLGWLWTLRTTSSWPTGATRGSRYLTSSGRSSPTSTPRAVNCTVLRWGNVGLTSCLYWS